MAKFNPKRQSGQNEPARPPDKLPLPQTTVQAFKASGSKSLNVGLIFDRYLHFTENRNCDWDMGTYNTGTRQSDTAKSWNLREIVALQKKLEPSWNNLWLAKSVDRWQHTVKSQHAQPFRMTPDWRFIVGLGDKTALEVGFTFHRIYGFPIIPGSSLKGLARTVALNEIADLLNIPKLGLMEAKKRAKAKKEKRCQQEECEMPLAKLDNLLAAYDERITGSKERELAKAEENKALVKLHSDVPKVNLEPYEAEINQFRQIFGTQYVAGEAIFFDAVPVEPPELELDVMNVHYKKYYSDDRENPKEYPSDDDDPTPIPFLTVGRTAFWFAVGWRSEVDQKGLKQARSWLETGLHDFGIGAKTATGYGYFEVM